MKNSIRSLQHMLNHLARTATSLPRLIETGIFDELTLEAVMKFQRDNNLPVTGTVDQTTWYSISDAYYKNLFFYGEPPPLHVFSNSLQSIGENEQAAEILITQAILTELSKYLSGIEDVLFDGVNSGSTHRNLRRLQTLSGLPDTGHLDRATWAILSALFRTFVTRKALTTLPL